MFSQRVHQSLTLRSSWISSRTYVRSSKRRPALTWKAYATLAFPATCFALGYWQVGRRKWKLDLLEKIDKQLNSPPVPLPLNVHSSTDLPEFYQVTVRGHFDHTREALIGPRQLIDDFIQPGGPGSEWTSTKRRDGSSNSPYRHTPVPIPSPTGYFVVTPFVLEERPNVCVLVNRGWIHANMRDPATRSLGQVKGTVEFSGIVRYPEDPPSVASKPVFRTYTHEGTTILQGQYYSRHIPVMAEHLGTLPLLIDASYNSSVPGGPVGGQTRIRLRNQHASYIFTWLSLGVIGSAMWIAYFLR